MTHTNRTQLTLTVIILVLVLATLLYGWIYASSLQYKFDSLVLNPQFIEKNEISQLKEDQVALKEKIRDLENLISNLNTAKASDSPASLAEISNSNTNIEYAEKLDLFVDSKCFEDVDNLNQCSVLSSSSIKDDFRVIIRPNKEITDSINEITFEFYQGDKKYTEIKTSTANLLDTTKPIASIAFITKNDITVETSVGLNNTKVLYNFDGNSWVDLNKYNAQ